MTRIGQRPAGQGGQRSALELPNGTVNLNASPWAEVWIDGQRVGETPIGNLSVPIGPHEVVFRHPQFGEKRHAISVTLSGAGAAQRGHEIRDNDREGNAHETNTRAAAAGRVLGMRRRLHRTARSTPRASCMRRRATTRRWSCSTGCGPGPAAGSISSRSSSTDRSCLLALGRGAEAEAAIAAVVYRRPDVSAQRGRSVAARAHRFHRGASASAAGDRARALRRREGHVRSQAFRARPNSSSANCSGSSTIPTWAAGSAICGCWSAGFLDLSAAAAAPPPEPAKETRPAPAAPPQPCRSQPSIPTTYSVPTTPALSRRSR